MITENNYEEYFLLYTDNELSEAERKAVETFVLQHPKYATELEMFLQTKLSVDNKVSFNKTLLYKQDTNEISIDNYEQYFLLHTDNELREEDKLHTERFVLQHPQLQEEFTLLQQTKLTVETFPFPDKQRLYKRERRVLPLYIKQMSIAAAICTVIASTWFLVNHQEHQNTAVAVRSVIAIKPIVKENENTIQNSAIEDKQGTQTAVLIEHKEKESSTINKVQVKKITENNVVPPVEKIDNKTPSTIEHSEDIAVVQTQTRPQPVEQVETLKPLVEATNEPANTQTALEVADDNTTKPAVYKEINTDEDDHTLYVGSLQLNKAKVNGFLKTASRVFGSKTKQNID